MDTTSQSSEFQNYPLHPSQYYKPDDLDQKQSNSRSFKSNLFILLLTIVILGGLYFGLYSNQQLFPQLTKKGANTPAAVITVTQETISIPPFRSHTNLPQPTQSSSNQSIIFTPTPTLVQQSITPSPTTLLSPFSNEPYTIKIVGDDTCKQQTNDALNLLKTKDYDHYVYVTNYVGIIECADQGSGMFAYENPPRYLAGKSTREAGSIWYAGTIVHDATHSKLYNDYLKNHPNETVPANVWSGKDAEQKCIDIQVDALAKIGADQAVIDYAKNAINANYWDVPYDQRNW